GETKELAFAVGISPSAAPQYYSVSFIVSYDAGRGTETEEKTLGVDVRGKTELTVITSTDPTPVTVSVRSYSLSAQVSNTGDSVVRALSVYVNSPLAEAIDVEANYIGNLEVDDYSNAQFAVITKQVPAGRYPVEIVLRYKDAFNNQREERKTAYVDVFSQEFAAATGAKGGDNAGWLVAALVIIGVGAYVVYVRFLRRKKHATL
ncbi:MAG: hypothetical protein AB1626_05055, partial [Candidatus Micrarchaeota archaeon]